MFTKLPANFKDSKKNEAIKQYCLETVNSMSLQDDADSRWRWISPLYATGWWTIDEIIDLFPTTNRKDHDHLRRQAKHCKRWVERRGVEGVGMLMGKLRQEGFLFTNWRGWR